MKKKAKARKPRKTEIKMSGVGPALRCDITLRLDVLSVENLKEIRDAVLENLAWAEEKERKGKHGNQDS